MTNDNMPKCNIELSFPGEDSPMKFELVDITECGIDKKYAWIEEEGWSKAVPNGVATITITGRLVKNP